MTRRITELIVFYVLILLPFYLLLQYMNRVEFLYGWVGIALFFAYAGLYRPYIDYLRLRSRGVISEKFGWGKAMNYNYRYFRQLFWI